MVELLGTWQESEHHEYASIKIPLKNLGTISIICRSGIEMGAVRDKPLGRSFFDEVLFALAAGAPTNGKNPPSIKEVK